MVFLTNGSTVDADANIAWVRPAIKSVTAGGLLFQAGKDGVGYLIDEATMSTDHAAVFKAQVCKGNGSFGGDAFANGVLYIACTNGTQALAYNETARTFTALWQGPSDAFGPPIVSAGLVWTVATGAFKGGGTKLYGLEPATGSPRYTETLPSPVIDHFASPSAAGGRLFVASGSSVTAYQIAQLPPTSSGAINTTSAPAGQRTVQAEAPTLLLRTRLRASRAGIVHLALRCTIKSGSCKGAVAIRAILIVKRGSGHHRVFRTVLVLLASRSFGPKKGKFNSTLRLDRHAMTLLRRHHDHLNVQVRISAPGYLSRRVQAVLR